MLLEGDTSIASVLFLVQENVLTVRKDKTQLTAGKLCYHRLLPHTGTVCGH